MRCQTRHKTALVALVLSIGLSVGSQASAQGRADAVGTGQSAVGLSVLSSTISVARMLGMPEQIQAAVIRVANQLDTDKSKTSPSTDQSHEALMPADADRQSAMESEALEALERGKPADSDQTREDRGNRAESEASRSNRRDRSGGAELGSRSEPKSVEGVIERHHDEITACYRKRLSARPQLAGSVTVKFIVQTDGSVAAPVIEKSSLGDEQVESCIVGLVEQLEFPEPVSNNDTVWKFPFQFRSGR